MKLNYVLLVLLLSLVSCQSPKGDYVCTPCDLQCDALFFSEPGICPHCNMALIKKEELELKVNEINIKDGSSSFMIEGGHDKDKTIIVHYHKPENFSADSKLIFVIPGAGRNGRDYRNAWIEQSEKYGLLVLSPEYSEAHYPRFWSYNLAGMIYDVDLQNETFEINQQSDQWIFEDFDRIFNLVKNELQLTKTNYDMFGHSAGGQILHRLALFKPQNKADRILAANAGWYTLPTDDESFPYGLKGLNAESNTIDFRSKLTLFLGEKDDANETRGDLRRSPEVDIQGLHRLARGKYFFATSQDIAKKLEKEFNWNLEIIPDVGHDYRAMSKWAAEYLYKDEENNNAR